MKIKRLLFSVVCVLGACGFFAHSPVVAKADYAVEAQADALAVAQRIEARGVLREKKNGFVYLDVSDAFVEEVIPLIEVPGHMIPIRTGTSGVGAHISVMTQQERRGVGRGEMAELGQEFTFSVMEVRSFSVKGMKLWALIVDAPQLEAVREEYGLAPLLQGHAFHITIGKQGATAGEGERPDFDPQEVEEIVHSPDYVVEEQPVAMECALSLPQRAVLKQKENGFVYLDVSNAFIDEVVPLLDLAGVLRPLPTAAASLGAHVTVFTEGELTKHEIWSIYEVGQEFSFSVKEIRSFTMNSPKGLKRVWAVIVDAPELEALRRSYGLCSKPKGYDFHISLGKQIPVGTGEEERLSELNFADESYLGLSDVGNFVVVDTPGASDVLQNLEGIGKLCVKSNGYVYLDVSNAYVDSVVPHLSVGEGFEKKSTKPKKVGAHISVILEDEMIKHQIWEVPESEELFTFTAKEVRQVDVTTRAGTKRLWLVAVECPGLERLREKYGLSPKLKGHDFHITLGSEWLPIEVEQEKSA